jgi:hypothetical protein
MNDWEPLSAPADAMDRAVRLYQLARKLEATARQVGDTDMLGTAARMRAKAEALAEIGLGHFGDDLQTFSPTE